MDIVSRNNSYRTPTLVVLVSDSYVFYRYCNLNIIVYVTTTT
jgi:hypothetical protein